MFLYRIVRVFCALCIWYLLLGIALKGAERNSSQELSPQVVEGIERDLKEGNFGEALSKAEKLVALNPNSARAYSYLGMASVYLNRSSQAMAAFERSIAINPRDPRPHFDLALLYAAQNHLEKAIHSYEAGLALDPQNPTALFNYGKLLIRQRRFADAAGALERMLRAARL